MAITATAITTTALVFLLSVIFTQMPLLDVTNKGSEAITITDGSSSTQANTLMLYNRGYNSNYYRDRCRTLATLNETTNAYTITVGDSSVTAAN